MTDRNDDYWMRTGDDAPAPVAGGDAGSAWSETLPSDDATSATPADEPEAAADALVVDIEQTRVEMSGTLDAIGAKLDPQVLAEQARETASGVLEQATETVRDAATHAVDNAKQTVRDATVGKVETMIGDASRTAQETTGGIVETIRQNPVPAALAGIGLYMLWQASNRNGGRRQVGGNVVGQAQQTAAQAVGTVQETAGTVVGHAQQTATQALGTVQQTAGNVVGQAQQTAAQAVGTVQETAAQAVGTVQQTAGQAVGTVQQTAGQAVGVMQDTASRAQTQIQTVLQENPLAAGAIAVAVGAAAALVLPTTRKEQELYGGPRDAVIGRAQEQIEGAIDRVEQTATA